MYIKQLMAVFCEVAGIEPADLDGEEWRSIFAVIMAEVGQPIAALTGYAAEGRRGRLDGVREMISETRRRLETDQGLRARIDALKQELADRVYEIEQAKAASVRASRAKARSGQRSTTKTASEMPVSLQGSLVPASEQLDLFAPHIGWI
jgi:hypothetical protein